MQHSRQLNSLKLNHNNKWDKPLTEEPPMLRDKTQGMPETKVEATLELQLLSNSQELRPDRSPRA